MIVREFRPEDIRGIHELYTRFYSSYEYHNFIADFKFACTVLDNDNNIIAAGGIKPIIELAAICNKDTSVRTRREALLHILQTSIFAAHKFNFSQLHVFSDDDRWISHLTSADFKLSNNKVLTLDI